MNLRREHAKRVHGRHSKRAVRLLSHLFRIALLMFLLFLPGIWLGSCRYHDPAIDWCDETNNCKDLPGTICNEERGWCVCPTYGDQWCDGDCRQEEICWGVVDGGEDAEAGDAGAE